MGSIGASTRAHTSDSMSQYHFSLVAELTPAGQSDNCTVRYCPRPSKEAPPVLTPLMGPVPGAVSAMAALRRYPAQLALTTLKRMAVCAPATMCDTCNHMGGSGCGPMTTQMVENEEDLAKALCRPQLPADAARKSL